MKLGKERQFKVDRTHYDQRTGDRVTFFHVRFEVVGDDGGVVDVAEVKDTVAGMPSISDILLIATEAAKNQLA